MKPLKFKRFGGARFLIVSILILSCTIFLTSHVYGAGVGDKISFTSRWYHNAVQFTAEDDSGYKGVCAQLGIERDPEGKATVERVFSSSSNTAKIAWHIYENRMMSSGDNPSGSGWPSQYTKAQLGMHMVQISLQGKSTWKSIAQSEGMSNSLIDKIVDRYDTVVSGEDAPSSFEVIYLNPGNATQHFIMWRKAPQGKLKLKKSSKYSGITG